MVSWVRRFLYRIFCVVALLVSVYLIVDFLVSGTFDYRIFTMFLLLVVVEIWGIIDWRKNYLMMRQKESELKLYQHYIRPLEELVKEIRAKQHEFDNHVNAILNMHLTVGDYDELVERQSAYIHEIRRDSANKYLPLLRISDKVLAGFLYSKIVSSPENVETDVEVRNWKLISQASEHWLIEIIGGLMDNAYEAAAEAGGKVRILLDSKDDRLVFEVFNQYRRLSIEEIGRFFEYGYSTKEKTVQKRGVGLTRVKRLIDKSGGEIMVGQEEVGGENYIHFIVTI